MNRTRRRRIGLAVAIALVAGAVAGVLTQREPDEPDRRYPPPQGFVSDFANVVEPSAEDALNADLSDYQRRTGNEVAVVTVRTLGGATVEEYTRGLANEWGVGDADRDNGVVLLLAVRERKMRLEVGRGIESVLTNREAADILDEAVRPRLRAGDYVGALNGFLRRVEAELPSA